MYNTQTTTKNTKVNAQTATSICDFYGEAERQMAQGKWQGWPLHWVANSLAATAKRAELEAKNPVGDLLWL